MAKRCYIIHGWEANPNLHWFPWLKKELKKLNFDVKVLKMPNTMQPKLSEWLSFLLKIAKNPNESTYLIGHSLGVITILRYLESLKNGQKIGCVILVAGFSTDIGYEEIASFTSKPLNYEKVKKSANKIVAIHSDNDPYVPIKQGQILKDKLNAELIIIPKAGQFNKEDGFTKLPVVLESIKNCL